MKGFIVLFFNKKKKNVKKVAFRGPRGIVAGTGAGTGRQILFPGDRGAEKRPGTSGNGFPGFPVTSLCSTAQSFIRKEVTSYKIHTLVGFLDFFKGGTL